MTTASSSARYTIRQVTSWSFTLSSCTPEPMLGAPPSAAALASPQAPGHPRRPRQSLQQRRTPATTTTSRSAEPAADAATGSPLPDADRATPSTSPARLTEPPPAGGVRAQPTLPAVPGASVTIRLSAVGFRSTAPPREGDHRERDDRRRHNGAFSSRTPPRIVRRMGVDHCRQPQISTRMRCPVFGKTATISRSAPTAPRYLRRVDNRTSFLCSTRDTSAWLMPDSAATSVCVFPTASRRRPSVSRTSRMRARRAVVTSAPLTTSGTDLAVALRILPLFRCCRPSGADDSLARSAFGMHDVQDTRPDRHPDGHVAPLLRARVRLENGARIHQGRDRFLECDPCLRRFSSALLTSHSTSPNTIVMPLGLCAPAHMLSSAFHETSSGACAYPWARGRGTRRQHARP
jgi:hypothetical protein